MERNEQITGCIRFEPDELAELFEVLEGIDGTPAMQEFEDNIDGLSRRFASFNEVMSMVQDVKERYKKYVPPVDDWDIPNVEIPEDEHNTEKEDNGLDGDGLYQLHSIGEMLKRPKPSYRIQGMLRDKGVSYIKAPPKNCKTTLVTDWMARVSLGWPTIDGRKTIACKVVVVCAEDADNVAAGYQGWMLRNGVADLPNIVFYDRPLHLVSEMPRFIETLKKKHPDVGIIVFDTQAACTRGIDENTKKEWDAVFSAVGNLWRTFKCSVILLHHEGISGKMRGTTDMQAEATTVVKVALVDQKDVHVLCEMARGKPFPNIKYGLYSQDLPDVDEFGEPVNVPVIGEPYSADSISVDMRPDTKVALEVLKTKFGSEGATNTKWRDATGFEKNKFNGIVRTCKDNGWVKWDGPVTKPVYYHPDCLGGQDQETESQPEQPKEPPKQRPLSSVPTADQIAHWPDDAYQYAGEPRNYPCFKHPSGSWVPYCTEQIDGPKWFYACDACHPEVVASKGAKYN